MVLRVSRCSTSFLMVGVLMTLLLGCEHPLQHADHPSLERGARDRVANLHTHSASFAARSDAPRRRIGVRSPAQRIPQLSTVEARPPSGRDPGNAAVVANPSSV